MELNHRIESVEERGNAVYVDSRRYDFLVDATWGHLSRPPIDLYYEPTILLYYEANCPFPAVTMVDGSLGSIYPTEDLGLFTLSTVPHTPLGRFATGEEARLALAAVDRDLVGAKIADMERLITRYLPGFRDVFRFVAPQLSIKTKPTGSFDDRSCHVFKRGRIFSVMSGKVDTIFFAVERILSLIEEMPEDLPRDEGGTLRDEIEGAAGHLIPG